MLIDSSEMFDELVQPGGEITIDDDLVIYVTLQRPGVKLHCKGSAVIGCSVLLMRLHIDGNCSIEDDPIVVLQDFIVGGTIRDWGRVNSDIAAGSLIRAGGSIRAYSLTAPRIEAGALDVHGRIQADVLVVPNFDRAACECQLDVKEFLSASPQ